ncbi:MAG: peptidase M10 [Chitinophagaceae bacterium]|nr:peptidase M10 [Chitinophagaceae bacterium]
MGEAELNTAAGELVIRSIFYFYGEATTPELATQIAADIQTHWNEPRAHVIIRKKSYTVRFEIAGYSDPALNPEKVWYNDNPRLNFFRLETFAAGNISFVDGLGSNTGYFLIDNLVQTSTTAAHEYGHTIGLGHPHILDIRGNKEPGIMYPRGNICDPEFQYWPHARPGEHGGFLDPKYRRVLASDIEALKLHKLDFDEGGFAKLGEFSSLYHQKHEA